MADKPENGPRAAQHAMPFHIQQSRFTRNVRPQDGHTLVLLHRWRKVVKDARTSASDSGIVNFDQWCFVHRRFRQRKQAQAGLILRVNTLM
jgi:3-hydroxymyristoyl/3-hydroxydecanoyl-(acyl carrier protein) dehydratase